MATNKIKSIRLSEDTLEFLTSVSFRHGYRHSLSDQLPNITQTIIQIISQYEIFERIGGDLNTLNDENTKERIAQILKDK